MGHSANKTKQNKNEAAGKSTSCCRSIVSGTGNKRVSLRVGVRHRPMGAASVMVGGRHSVSQGSQSWPKRQQKLCSSWEQVKTRFKVVHTSNIGRNQVRKPFVKDPRAQGK